MRTLINYLRSCFCKHDWILLQESDIYNGQTTTRPYKTTWTYRCTKCCCRKKIST